MIYGFVASVKVTRNVGFYVRSPSIRCYGLVKKTTLCRSAQRNVPRYHANYTDGQPYSSQCL